MRRSRKIAVIAAVLLLAAGALTCSACSGGYILRAGVEEAKILANRRPIPEVIADPATPPEAARRLRLVLAARDYAEDALALDAGDSYTTYSRIDRDTLALVMSAAEKDRFALVTWWFPIVGRVPYKGFFDVDDALEAERELQGRGYDTFLRTTGAFSTLGWFNDPILTTTLRYDDVGLASTVIHELTHNTIYLPGQAAFNESFANFVGDRGAIELFCRLEGESGERCMQARADWADNQLYADFLQDLVHRLEALYGRDDLTREQKIEMREEVFDDARARFETELRPRLRTRRFLGFSRAPLNNATLIARRLYYDRLHLFEAAYQRLDRDLPRSIRTIAEAAEAADDPWAALERLAGG